LIWGRNAEHLEELKQTRSNQRYLPTAEFPPSLNVESDLEKAVSESTDLLLAVPSHAFRELLTALEPLLRKSQRICWATKGFELDTGKLPHEVAAEVLGTIYPLAVLSGPTFAREVGMGLPTAMTVASDDQDFADELAEHISDDNFRAYTSSDVIGVEVGGAVKNVLAIGAGVSDGLGYGSNTRIALITRGLVELGRLGHALGARPETFMGLAGMGDLVLTCTDNQSRNRRMGLALAEGKSSAEAAEEIAQVVEGVMAARAVHQVSLQHRVEMPICEQVYRMLYQGATPESAVKALMTRDLKSEDDSAAAE
jgi:glycerol-3-phosphate dehydrogenase (NAD(P)+)